MKLSEMSNAELRQYFNKVKNGERHAQQNVDYAMKAQLTTTLPMTKRIRDRWSARVIETGWEMAARGMTNVGIN